MKKNISAKTAGCSNGHARTHNGRADDEGGGNAAAAAARVSYAAAARKPSSPGSIATPAPFPLPTGTDEIYMYLHHFIIL